MRRTALLILLTLCALPLSAQAPDDLDSPWQFHAGIGWPILIGSMQNSANGLLHTEFGANRRVTPRLRLRLDFGYDAFNPSDKVLKGYGATEGRAQIYSLSADLQFKVREIGWGEAYVLGGVSTNYKHAFVQNPTAITICDPFWGCAVGGSDTIVGTKADTSYGMNAGIGYEMPLTTISQLFIEMKYQFVNAKSGGFEFVPLTIGARF
jgi:hypothetical protein